MKKVYISLLLALCAVPSVFAQSGFDKVRIYGPKIEKDSENVTVSFRAVIDHKAAKRNYSVVFAPALTDGTYYWSCPAVIVRGKGAELLEDRHLMASGRTVSFNDAYYAANGEDVDYRVTIPYQLWMEGAQLVMEGINIGCCSYSEFYEQIMVQELALSPPPVAEPDPDPVPPPMVVVAPELTVADKLAEQIPYIRPFSEYDGEIYDEDRENALIVYFRQGISQVQPDFGSNRRSLSDLISSVLSIQNSADSEVKMILIAGFASPEGSFALNDRLAWNRAVAVKEYTVDNTRFDPDNIRIHNGSEDWHGLRRLVEQSNMYEKREILDIIDNVPVEDSRGQPERLNRLKRLGGGQPYKYMLEHYFPQLRNAAYIKVYYENK